MKTTEPRLTASGFSILGMLLIAAAPAFAQPRPPAQPAARYPNEVRSVDGSGNNRANPDWGRAGEEFLRRTTVGYEDGKSAPAGGNRPSPRAISNTVAAAEGSRPNRRGASDFLWQWGQFLDHDLDLTTTADPAEPFPIEIPAGDPQFDPKSTGQVIMALGRSAYNDVAGVRQQVNGITAYIDASQVYGSDAVRARALRALDGTGRLKTSAGNLLPLNTEGLANFPPGDTVFVAGDIRVNEQVGLTAIQTLFLREHNFWADDTRRQHPDWSDEQIYQQARAIVGAEIQGITYREFLPVLLGPTALRPYRGYQPRVNAGVENVFATAAYRLGHSLLSANLLRLGPNRQPIAQGHLPLASAFFNQQALTSVGVEPYLRGLATQRAQELDSQLVDAVRNFLFGPPGAGGFDLASLNIQRGRDHGLPGYNQLRADLGLPRVESFDEISSNPAVQARLDAVYTSVDDVDAWVGGLAEDDLPGAMVGETFFIVLRDQFERLRDGDRFWHEGYLPADLLRLVRSQTLAQIIRRNTAIRGEIQDNVFVAPRPR
ncbi:MAG TPA: peroxidase family protein [Thermoanaerobaculia bacterium]|nr:peroxidase family protein [Thermoanaerobaculia bacterium]